MRSPRPSAPTTLHYSKKTKNKKIPGHAHANHIVLPCRVTAHTCVHRHPDPLSLGLSLLPPLVLTLIAAYHVSRARRPEVHSLSRRMALVAGGCGLSGAQCRVPNGGCPMLGARRLTSRFGVSQFGASRPGASGLVGTVDASLSREERLAARVCHPVLDGLFCPDVCANSYH